MHINLLVVSCSLSHLFKDSIYISYGVIVIKSVPITTKVVSSNPTHGEVYLIQHYVIKFVSDLRQVGGFLWVLWFHPMKLKTEILLKVALNTITLTVLWHLFKVYVYISNGVIVEMVVCLEWFYFHRVVHLFIYAVLYLLQNKNKI